MAGDTRVGPLPMSRSVGVVGAGTMGAGIAQVAAQAGHEVLLYDTRPGAAEKAVAGIGVGLSKLVAKGRLRAEEVEATRARLRGIEALGELSGCGLIVEAIVEDPDEKRKLFCALEDLCDEETLFATNTSSLSVTAIGAALRLPGRLGGMHFFNPAAVMPLVEIVAGMKSAWETLDTLQATAAAWGKQTIRARSTPGFVVNRVARPFYGEALRLLAERAASVATLDALLREAGEFRMGPFELMDLIGLDINFAVTRSVFEATFQDPRFAPSLLQRELVEANRLGRKTGQGFYTYADGGVLEEPESFAESPFPASVRLFGNDPLTQVLQERLREGGGTVALAPAHADGRLAQTAHACLYRTDGRSATQRAEDVGQRSVVLVDLARDVARARRLGIAAADQAHALAAVEIAGLLQTAGYAVSRMDDAPGMAVLRTVAMLANEAADAVQQGVCTVEDCDKAMRLGTSYPLGPLEWADVLGAANVVAALDWMHAAYGEPRYRVSPLLRRKALTGAPFYERGDAR